MEAAKTTSEADYDSLVAEAARAHSAKLITRFFGRLEALARSPAVRIRPRLSLASGALFVLSTLFLPLAMNSCGTGVTGPGLNVVTGGENSFWPSLFLLEIGRGLYVLLLIVAVSALGFTVYRLIKPNVQTSHQSPKVLLALTGAVSLLLLTGYSGDFVFLGGDQVVASWDIASAVAPFLPLIVLFCMFLICTRCLRAKSVRASLLIRSLFALIGVLALAALTVESYSRLRGHASADFAMAVTSWGPPILYFVGPLMLWFRYGLWPRENSNVLWPPVRQRLTWIYIPALAGQLWAAYQAVKIGVWGLIPCLIGIHLITYGYLQLLRETTANEPAIAAVFAETAN